MIQYVMTKVVKVNEPYDVYIGRPSIWGNPYSHKDGTLAEFKVRTRKESIDKYKEYFLKNPELMKRLPELEGKILGCHCKPLPCHGDFLADLCNNKPKVNLEDL